MITFDRYYIISTYPEVCDDEFVFEIDDGWMAHINVITDNIMKWIKHFNSDYNENVTMKILQIKEKFGGLRYYYTLLNYEDMSDENFKIFDTLRTDVSLYVSDMEKHSYHICESCGMYGETVRMNGWLKTLCKFHKGVYDND